MMRRFFRSCWTFLSRRGHGANADPPAPSAQAASIRTVLSSMRGAFLGIAAFSGIINLLALTGSLFMLQVYDRVLPSQSVPTLVALTVVVAGLFLFQAGFDVIRSRLLVRVASRVDESFGERTYRAVLGLPLRMTASGDGLQPIRDLDTVRGFLSGPGPAAIFDLPWIPIYLIFVYLLHPLLGLIATGGVVLLLILTFLTDHLSRASTADATAHGQHRAGLAAEGRKNAEVLHSMGFADRMVERWLAASERHLTAQQAASDVSGGFGSVAKVFRSFLQSAILATGAYLVIKGDVSAGAIIASSITSSRALAPIDTAISHWKSFLAARQAIARLETLLRSPFAAVKPMPMPLPAPTQGLTLDAVAASAPGLTEPLIQNVSFRLKAGQGLGVIGQSAAGKSTLLRAIVGAWPLLRGTVRLDGATLDQWHPSQIGRHIGHLPQDPALFDGTIAENIARFDPAADPAAIFKAAQAVNVHKMILMLPQGYETRIGPEGGALSSGQRQRIGLARAFYGDPFLIVLDEPSANLDTEGEDALTVAIRGVMERGGIIIVVTHRPSAIAALDLVAVMSEGTLQYFGLKAEVLRQTLKPASKPAPSLPDGGALAEAASRRKA
ncbi:MULTISPECIES: type I secretion system permease/ATPase [Rhodomicrobium]|uniref:type I secretion system permease/ATPase n=1 Tax=Rhodomicrobium TaxID=1068 RepID=UPI001FDA1F05|nr:MULTISPECIES: type I secretion system permease/ATPase [Rhodomicrobium]